MKQQITKTQHLGRAYVAPHLDLIEMEVASIVAMSTEQYKQLEPERRRGLSSIEE
jgi:hypothetical protein